MKLTTVRFALGLSLLLPLAAPPAAAAQQPRPMTIADLIEVPSVGDPQLSPDGSQIVFVRSDAHWRRNEMVSHLWRVDADGTDLVQLTSGEDGEREPRWSPDGRRIAFLAERGEDEHNQIYLLSNAGGEGIRLTDHPTAVNDIAWSPDARWIYFTAEDPKTAEEKERERREDNVYAFDENWKHRHLWRVDARSGRAERLTGGDFTVRGYTLSPDGRTLALQRADTPLLDDGPATEVWLADADGANARRLTDNTAGEGNVRISPDGSQLLFVANANQDYEFYYNDNLFVMPTAGGPARMLMPELPYEVGDAEWAADGRSIFFTANQGVRQNVMRLELASGQVAPVTEGDHSVRGWSYHPRLNRHVYQVSSPTDAGDIRVLDAGRRNARPQQVTRLFDDLDERFQLPKVEAITWRGEDGVEVEGLLSYPLDYQPGQRYPLVVQTHGGPAASDKFAWHSSHDYVPVLAGMGYMVLQPNYRGSTGYGDAFLRDMVGNYFNQAHKDVMAGVDHLIAQGLVDGERMAKMGWSAGGHMTNKIITYTDRFKAASSGAGAINWISMYGQSDTRVYRTPWFGGTPWEENAPIDQYLADSPLLEIHRVATPTLVLVGENDARVPMPQSVELYRALKANDVPARLYVAPRQGHGWRELQQRLFKANAELDWFERYVRGQEYTWERSPESPADEGE